MCAMRRTVSLMRTARMSNRVLDLIVRIGRIAWWLGVALVLFGAIRLATLVAGWLS